MNVGPAISGRPGFLILELRATLAFVELRKHDADQGEKPPDGSGDEAVVEAELPGHLRIRNT
jgi:hypothetical protein